ncbi:hypothetical protein NEDG_00384 [Nematocida displodere]|uniref:Uncharacterized protein n=1 Tax=Nematocida displodere TaxID=1805483 RepID=A0A177ELQ3_9MICR|nr:hypothetical protein NEDG_00384 [Nematocida displodere]
MECALFGVSGSIDEIIKYITLTEYATRVERVTEVVYSYMGYSISLSREEVLHSVTEEGVQPPRALVYLKVAFPPDRSKSRKTLTRRILKTEVTSGRVEPVLETIGCTRPIRREYTRKAYSYRGAQLEVLTKDGKDLVTVKASLESVAASEAVLHEVKEKLKIWIDLVVPPPSVWKCL